MNAIAKPRTIEREPEYLSIADRMPAAKMKRMEEYARLTGDRSFGFPVGKMKMMGDFGKTEANPRYEACVWYFTLHAEYHRIIASKGITPQSMSLESKSQSADPDSDAGQAVSRREEKIIRRYKAARSAALAAGVDNFAAFVSVVIEEQEPSWALKMAVVKVADALRRHRNLSRRKSQREREGG